MLVITNGTVFVSAHRVQIATFNPISITHWLNFASAHRVQIATGNLASAYMRADFVSAHSVRITTVRIGIPHGVVILCLSALRADHNGKCA